MYEARATRVITSGFFRLDGEHVNNDSAWGGLRPALWLNIES
jgi:hypothetical protein